MCCVCVVICSFVIIPFGFVPPFVSSHAHTHSYLKVESYPLRAIGDCDDVAQSDIAVYIYIFIVLFSVSSLLSYNIRIKSEIYIILLLLILLCIPRIHVPIFT